MREHCSLSQYINEEKIRVNNIIDDNTFERLWYKAMDDDFSRDDKDDIKLFGSSTVYMAFMYWIQTLNIEQVPMKEALRQLKQMPLERVQRIIGAGGFGCVLEIDKVTVIKWLYAPDKSERAKRDARFYEYCYKNWKTDPNIPRVYKYKEGKYVVMERLDTKDKDIPEFTRICGVSVNKPPYKYKFKKGDDIIKTTVCIAVQKGLEPTDDAPEEAKKAYKWCNHFYSELSKKIDGFKFPGDCYEDNIGARHAGDAKNFVWFDI